MFLSEQLACLWELSALGLPLWAHVAVVHRLLSAGTASPAIRASALSPLPLPKEGAKTASDVPIQQEASPEITDTYLQIVAYLY